MGEGVNLQTRRALLKQFAPQYRKEFSKQKRVLLDAFAQATGYHRRYGMWLLNHADEVKDAPRYVRSRKYGPEVQLSIAHICLISTSGSVRCGRNAEISRGGVCPRIMAARLSATTGAWITP